MADRKLFYNIRHLIVSCPGTVTIDKLGNIALPDESVHGEITVTKLAEDRLEISGGLPSSASSNRGFSSTVTNVGWGGIGSVISSGNSVSISNNTIRCGPVSAKITGNGARVEMSMPTTSTLIINGKTMDLGALKPLPPKKKLAYTAKWEANKLAKISLAGECRLVFECADAIGDQLQISSSGCADFSFGDLAEINQLKLSLSGQAKVNGGGAEVDVLKISASGQSSVVNFRVIDSGKFSLSGMASAMVSAYARECIKQQVSGRANVQIALIVDKPSSKKRKAEPGDNSGDAKRAKQQKE